MTTQSITELSSFFSVSAGANLAQTGGGAKAQTDLTFSQMMDKAGSSSSPVNEAGRDKSLSDKDSCSGRSADVVNEHGRQYDSAEKISDASKPVKDLDRDELRNSVKEIIGEIKETIKEQLNVTDEDIQEALDVLALTMVDLLNPTSLQEVYTEVSTAEDSLSLLTDADLYQGLTAVIDELEILTGQLEEEFGLTREDFSEVISQALNAEDVVSEEDGLVEMTALDDDSKKGPVIQITDERSVTSDISAENENVADVTVKPERSDKDESSRGQMRDNSDGGQSLASFTQQNAQQIEDIVFNPTQTVSYTTYSDAQDIARQIASQIRVSISNEATQMEMELNPASLGRVGLSIEAKNGVITAQFSAQNEAVRAAIEGQIATLQETLDKQGVKVEAVEVTIASHAFEENLDKNSDREQHQEESQRAQAVSGRRRMRINLMEDESDEDEEITEEEKINRDMMQRSGNTVDYTA